MILGCLNNFCIRINVITFHMFYLWIILAVQYDELQDISGIPTSSPWTRDDYDNAVEMLQSDSGQKRGEFGVNSQCVLNSLNSFHCVGQFPLDSLHDVLEKVLPCDAASILSGLAGEGKFTLEEYNRTLGELCLQSYERSDRPPPVKARCEKLPGTALVVALHIRLMPYVLWRMGADAWFDETDESGLLRLLLLLHKINEFIQADSINLADINNFEDLLVFYFELRKECADKYSSFQRITPKYHYLEHYPHQMKNFGPLNSFWTARAEAKHRVFVNFAESAKNFVNLPKTLAVKHQKLLASR